MTKVARSYYSAAVSHKQIDGLYHGTIGIPGEPPQWVLGRDGKPDNFQSRDGALLAGFRLLISRLNRARQQQDFQVRGERAAPKNKIRSWSAPPESGPTVDSVFGRIGK